MAVYSNLSDGELLGQLRSLAMEARDRLAEYLDRAENEDTKALHEGIVFAEKVERALKPSRGEWDGSVYWLKKDLLGVAAQQPEDEPDPEWSEFLDAHPELEHESQSEAPAVARQALNVDDAAIVDALRKALDDEDQKWDAVWSSGVARALLAELKVEVPGGGAWHSVVIRVSLRLSKLAKRGTVVQLRPRTCGSCHWTLPDRELSDETRREMLVVRGGDVA